MSSRVIADRESGAVDDNHYLQLNVYVTGYKGQGGASNSRISRSQATLSRGGNAGLGSGKKMDPNKLLQLLEDPQISSSDQSEVQVDEKYPPNRLGDIWVWNGRPDWIAVFENTEEHVVKRKQAKGDHFATVAVKDEVGVCFCG